MVHTCPPIICVRTPTKHVHHRHHPATTLAASRCLRKVEKGSLGREDKPTSIRSLEIEGRREAPLCRTAVLSIDYSSSSYHVIFTPVGSRSSAKDTSFDTAVVYPWVGACHNEEVK